MPEGPEIRRAADRVEAVIGGRRAEDVFFAFPRLAPFAERLRGCEVTSVETRGKAMLTFFDRELAVYSHNQLYGRWFVRKTGGYPRTRRQLRFAVHTAAGSALLYSASEIHVLDRAGLFEHPFLAKLGPDPLHAATTAKTIRQRLTAPECRRRNLGALMLDQSFVAGLGNYLRSEILFVAGVHPARRPSDLSPDELARLARTINQVTRRAYRTGGVTCSSDVATPLKKAGQPRRRYRHYVFARGGLPCRTCGDPITKLAMAGRRVYVCSTCQPR